MDRHQSPFSQKRKALSAFDDLFQGVIDREAQLILSYSNSGVVAIKEILELAANKFNQNYILTDEKLDYKHSTMGRLDDADRDVVEYLIIAKLREQ